MKRILISLLGLLMTVPVYAQYYQNGQDIYIDSEITFRPYFSSEYNHLILVNIKEDSYGNVEDIGNDYNLADLDGRIFALADLLRETFTALELSALGELSLTVNIIYSASKRPLEIAFELESLSLAQTIPPAKVATFYRKIKQRIQIKTTFNPSSQYRYLWRGGAKINHILEGFIPEDNLDLPK